MTIANVLSVTFAILGAIVAFSSFWLLVSVLMPRHVQEARLRLSRTPGKCFAAGLPLALILLVGGVGLLQGGAPAKLAGTVMFASGVVLASIGLAGLSALIGDRLPSPVDRDRPWRSLIRGALCLQFSWVLPFIGFPGIAALSIIAGLGAAALGTLRPLSGSKDVANASSPEEESSDEEKHEFAGTVV